MNFLKSLARAALLGIAVFAVSQLVAPQQSQGADYTVTLSTIVPTASAADFSLGAYPNIANGAYIRNIVLSNGGATAQVVTLYDTCTSSMTATVAAKIDLPAAIGAVQLPAGQAFLPNVWRLTNPCFTKSATGSAVQATILYE